MQEVKPKIIEISPLIDHLRILSNLVDSRNKRSEISNNEFIGYIHALDDITNYIENIIKPDL